MPERPEATPPERLATPGGHPEVEQPWLYGGEPDLSQDGGGQRTEVGHPYDGEGNERGIPPNKRR